MSGDQRVRAIAVGAALVAVALAIAATIVVVRRAPARVAATGSAGREPIVAAIPAAELVKLRAGVLVAAPGGTGITVTDAALRTALGLAATDVITAISGRPVKREFDVYDAILGVAQLGATVVYVEVERNGRPQLLRWTIDGDLTQARRANATASLPSPRHGTYDPFAPSSGGAVADPLVDTVERIDDTHAAIPRATLQRLLDDPTLLATGARIVPSVRNGAPDGFKLYAIRPQSFYARLNMMNGDTIRAVNGYELSSADRAQEIFAKLGGAATITVDITRRGQPLILVITVK